MLYGDTAAERGFGPPARGKVRKQSTQMAVARKCRQQDQSLPYCI